LEILNSQVNIFILGAILFLAVIDIVFKKDLKSQIVSLGVLGTFIGIFIGLQDFNPEDIKNSINHILLGLKTAFFTSIVGMGTALILSIIQKLFSKKLDSSNQNSLLLEISKKLDTLERLDNSKNTDKIIDELKQLKNIQTNTLDETSKIYSSINELKENSNNENQKLIKILNVNFDKMNNSLEVAIDKLSKGATEEIIKALEHVIKEFNNELQSSFGDNFTKLNDAIINLLAWQNNYKTHIEHIEQHLNISTSSIEKSKESLEIISSKNEAVLLIYKQLKNIIHIYHHQIKELNQHLETYAHLSDNAENMFSTITKNISKTTEEFEKLTNAISSSNQEQKKSFLAKNEEIMESYSILTQYIKEENNNQAKSHKDLLNQNHEDFSKLAQTISLSNQEIKESHLDLTKNIKSESKKQIDFNKELFNKNKEELDNITKHFNNLGEEIPKALQISLTELNRGLTSLTKEFQKSYEEIMNKYKNGINNE
jgi:Tfp pilus assembly protein PilE